MTGASSCVHWRNLESNLQGNPGTNLLPDPEPAVPHGRERVTGTELHSLRRIADSPRRKFRAAPHVAERGLGDPFNGHVAPSPCRRRPVLSPVEESGHLIRGADYMIEPAGIRNHDNLVNIIHAFRRQTPSDGRPLKPS